MNATLSLFLELGVARIERHVRSLTDRLVGWAASRREVRLFTPAEPERRAGIVAFTMPGFEEASKRLRMAGVTHSVREGAIRLAPHFHNTLGEVETVLTGLT
jgi:selenocysteine lyase/cysteine desulfurase